MSQAVKNTQLRAGRLKCAVQSYDWGKPGLRSKVAQYAVTTPGGFDIYDEKPYAELWMGTHPNGPSLLADQPNTSLKDLISQNPDLYLSSKLATLYDNDLPFLFKVLSVEKALSIQAHPDKKLGRQLYEKFPNLYKDPNHKPEMAIAITKFEALCGFRPLEEIKSSLLTYPQFKMIVGEKIAQRFIETVTNSSDVDQNKVVLREVFESVMKREPEIVSKKANELADRLREQAQVNHRDSGLELGSIPELVIRLNQQFPGDVGIFCVFLLNYVLLEPGQAIFLGANEPHAYLSGDCVECMAASDNVVRAGLTPKFKDVNVLVDMLTYRYGSASSQILKPEPYDPITSKHSLLYNPPIEEFSVILTQLSRGSREIFVPINGPSILIVTEGKGSIKVADSIQGETIEKGSVYFVGADSDVILSASEESESFVSYRAFCR
ncbi:hypothetical protein G9A89_013447 [Geosiphon pyriformis]|nr:hypothetical protein G9A89_013447 [Geosiphon pyriformis]